MAGQETPGLSEEALKKWLKTVEWKTDLSKADAFLTPEQLEMAKQTKQERRGLVMSQAVYEGESEQSLAIREKSLEKLKTMREEGVTYDQAMQYLKAYTNKMGWTAAAFNPRGKALAKLYGLTDDDFETWDIENRGERAKGKGWLGTIKLPGGGVASEYTVGVGLDGKEVEIPTLVPTLTKAEVELMRTDIIPNGKKVPKAIMDKAVEHAKKRMKQGKSVFVD
jgi:hypothetical protein